MRLSSATALKLSKPQVKVIGVEPVLGADAQASLRAGKIVHFPPEQVTQTIADGLRAQYVGEINFEHIRRYVDDIISVLFTATADVTSTFPATAIRAIGFGAVPLLCAAEIAVPGSKPLCIRVLLHVHTTRSREEIRHVYLHGAQWLRDDLPG